MAMLIARGWIYSTTGGNANTSTYRRNRVRFIDYYDITQYEIYLFGLTSMNLRWTVRCYDEDHNYIKTELEWSTEEHVTGFAPETRYVRVCIMREDSSDLLDSEIPIINANISIVPIANGSSFDVHANPIYVYAPDCEDFDNTGEVGDLKPISAVFTEEKNSLSEIKIRLTYDEYKKWKACRSGAILKCEVPVRMPPVIGDDEYATTTTVYS